MKRNFIQLFVIALGTAYLGAYLFKGDDSNLTISSIYIAASFIIGAM